jgi:glycosyltransferase involved in cell wall biosynthesis
MARSAPPPLRSGRKKLSDRLARTTSVTVQPITFRTFSGMVRTRNAERATEALKMNVLQVIAEFRPGGAERVVLSLADAAQQRADTMAIASAGGTWLPLAEERGVKTFRVPASRRSPVRMAAAAARLTQVIRSFNPDVVHSHNVAVTVVAATALAAARSRAPLISSFHGVPHESYGRAAKLLKWSRARVVACSPTVGRALTDHGYPAGDIAWVPNGARLDPPDESRIAAVRERYQLPRDTMLAVGLGRLVPQKAWERLIAAASEVEGMQFLVGGEGYLLEELRATAASQGGRVRFLGAVDDVAALLATSRCLVSTSRWEGLPVTMIEAMSLGTPVVATAVDGVTDLLTSECAILVDPAAPSDVAPALQSMADNAALASSLADGARRIARKFSPDLMARRYWRIYEKELSCRAGAEPSTTAGSYR